MNKWVLLCLCLSGTPAVVAQMPPVVKPGTAAFFPAPGDAVRLFEGSNVEGWKKEDGSATGCKAEQGEMRCRTGAKDAFSVEKHRDAQLHFEFRIPPMPEQKGQLRGNSGIFLMGCYELQVLDGFENPTYADGMLGALYKFAPPLVNAARPPGEWQSYDITFSAPKCNASGEVVEHARASVLLNGVLVQKETLMDPAKMPCRIRKQNLCAAGPIVLQDHAGFPEAPDTDMRFRNIWLRHLR